MLVGDDFYEYMCIRCTRGRDVLHRLKLGWVEILHVILYHLTASSESSHVVSIKGHEKGECVDGGKKMVNVKLFHWKVLVDYARLHWTKFWAKSPQKAWQTYLTAPLSQLSGQRFANGKILANLPGAAHTLCR